MNEIKIEVAYTRPDEEFLFEMKVPVNSTIQMVIEQSGLLILCQEINLVSQKVGIYGKQYSLNDLVKDGDRVEIYRPLIVDPKEARLRRGKRNKIVNAE